MQSLFICTGCDFVSRFHGVSKTAFYEAFQCDFKFITGGKHPGTLDQAGADDIQDGLLAFCRLVGSAYFRKYTGAFLEDSPEDLF